MGWCESGILLHAPLYGDLARTGLKIHLRHDRSAATVRAAGALYDLVPPLALANKGAKEWNALEIRMNWPSLQVTLNDVLIQDVKLDRSDQFRWRARRGYIGFEDLGFEVRYRNIAIHELPDTDREWKSLFNKADLTGWTAEGAARWTVEEGRLAASGGDGFLPDPPPDKYLQRLRRRAFLAGLTVSGTAIGNTFTYPAGPDRDREIAYTKLWIDRAADMGAPTIRIFAGNLQADLPRVVRILKRGQLSRLARAGVLGRGRAEDRRAEIPRRASAPHGHSVARLGAPRMTCPPVRSPSSPRGCHQHGWRTV